MRSAWSPHLAAPAPREILETKSAWVVVCRCNNYSTKVDAVQSPAKNHKAKKVNAGKNTQEAI